MEMSSEKQFKGKLGEINCIYGLWPIEAATTSISEANILKTKPKYCSINTIYCILSVFY